MTNLLNMPTSLQEVDKDSIQRGLKRLSSDSLAQLHQLLLLTDWVKPPNNFIFSGYVKTKDEHDADNPIKAFPDKAYLREVINVVHTSDRLFIPKSRQIRMSWVMVLYALWVALFSPHQAIFIQSKKEEDAAALVFDKKMENSRMSFVYHHLPEWLKEMIPVDTSYAKMRFGNGSIVWGIPEGGHIIRSHTASLVISDECAFQPEFEDAYTAAVPMAKKIVGLSSANGGTFFGDVVTEVI